MALKFNQNSNDLWTLSDDNALIATVRASDDSVTFSAGSVLKKGTDFVALAPITGTRIAYGQLTTASATDTVVTGLATVVSVVACYDTDPADANTYVSATIGDQAGSPAAGSIIIKTWKTDGSDPTPAAADAFSKKVNWIAIGT